MVSDRESFISGRARAWQIRGRTLSFGGQPSLMGIINVTPDSFSDGGSFLAVGAAVDHGLKLASEGADILDVGGESTRPNSQPVTAEVELQRVLPVVKELVRQTDVPISIDTSKPAVARCALEEGVHILNDVTGLSDPQMIELARAFSPGVCVMHMQGIPLTMQDDPQYDDVVGEIFEFLRVRRDRLVEAGIESQRVCLDPGIGFGKTHQQNLELLSQAWRFHRLGCPLLLGHSRKGFIAKLLGDKHRDRVFGTLGVSLSLASQGIQVVRVHEVGPTREAFLTYAASGGPQL